jgi:hypothetical protein
MAHALLSIRRMLRKSNPFVNPSWFLAEIVRVSGANEERQRREIILAMATYLTRPCPHCNGYLGIVLREPGRNMPVRAINGQCLKCSHRLA